MPRVFIFIKLSPYEKKNHFMSLKSSIELVLYLFHVHRLQINLFLCLIENWSKVDVDLKSLWIL